MVAFYTYSANDRNKLATLLWSQTFITEEFMQQSSLVAIGATIDTPVIEFDQKKYE